MDRERMTAMREATALTRAGRLAEATALIRRTLSGAPPAAPVDVVQGEVVVDDGAPPARHHRQPAAPPDRDLPPPGSGRAGPDSIALPASPALPGVTTARTHRAAA